MLLEHLEGDPMSEINEPILVAVDSSTEASGVLAEAVALGRTLGAPLLLVRVVSWPIEEPASLYSTMGSDSMLELVENEALRDLQALAGQVPSDVLVQTHVAHGKPWQAICDNGRINGARLIVIGAHGHSGLQRMIGTTAARVVNHADRSVLVVKHS
jgi:nucleotide-binding universal stress UspA family protein